jgi:hypothetical protein
MRKVFKVGLLVALGLNVFLGLLPAEAASSPTITIVPSPNPSPTESNYFESVSCSSPTWCAAIGIAPVNSFDQTLVETWNGTSWSLVQSPNVSTTTTNELFGVACPSATSCFAVGDYYVGPFYQTLIESWNGNSWSIVPSPNTSTSITNSLEGVTCTSPTSCIAVGITNNGTNLQTLVESWDGASWTIVTSPNTSASQDNLLSSVSCTSSTSCVAAGRYYNGSYFQTLIESWDGASWTIVPSQNTSPGQSNVLTSVSCPTTTSCMAAGEYYDGSHQRTLIESWDGNSWTIVPSPNTSSTLNNVLRGISCSSPSNCLTVGYANDGTLGGISTTLVESWDGNSWTIVPSPNTSATRSNVLVSISCSSSTSCMAVGQAFGGSYLETLAMTFQDLPSSPSMPTVTPGDGRVTVSWSAVAGADSYSATASPGGASCTTTTTSCVITGLTNGVPYSISVTATNGAGTSDPSPSVSATPTSGSNGTVKLAATGSNLAVPLGLAVALMIVGTTAVLAPRGRRL